MKRQKLSGVKHHHARNISFLVFCPLDGSLVTKSCLILATSRTVARQAPLSMGFSRQEYWSGLPLPSPRDLPNPGIEPGSPAMQADPIPSEPPGKLVEMQISAATMKNSMEFPAKKPQKNEK